jgi:hypothetical protein
MCGNNTPQYLYFFKLLDTHYVLIDFFFFFSTPRKVRVFVVVHPTLMDAPLLVMEWYE